MKSDSPPIYLLPGMTADDPVYTRLLPILPNARVVDFIDPAPNESLTLYAQRMAEALPSDCYIGGLSFGGIVAFEIARVLRPRGCILISSISHPRQLPPWFRAWRFLGGRTSARIMRVMGDSAALVPHGIRTHSTIRLSKLAGLKGSWHRWATAAVLDWSPDKCPLPCSILRIHGDADTTFPIRFIDADIVVRGGHHALPISNPVETANAIAAFTKVV